MVYGITIPNEMSQELKHNYVLLLCTLRNGDDLKILDTSYKNDAGYYIPVVFGNECIRFVFDELFAGDRLGRTVFDSAEKFTESIVDFGAKKCATVDVIGEIIGVTEGECEVIFPRTNCEHLQPL